VPGCSPSSSIGERLRRSRRHRRTAQELRLRCGRCVPA
jgi:hypothetical protein